MFLHDTWEGISASVGQCISASVHQCQPTHQLELERADLPEQIADNPKGRDSANIP